MLTPLKRPGNEGKLDPRIAQLSTRRSHETRAGGTLVPQLTKSDILRLQPVTRLTGC